MLLFTLGLALAFGIVWVSLILTYFTEVRRTPLVEHVPARFPAVNA
jgi:hypothetical protein